MDRLEFLETMLLEEEELNLLAQRILIIIRETYSQEIDSLDFEPLSKFMLDLKNVKTHKRFNIDNLISSGVIDGMQTDFAYELYLEKAKNFNSVMSKAKFSRFLRSNYGYETKLKHFPELGISKRIYSKIPKVNNSDNDLVGLVDTEYEL